MIIFGIAELEYFNEIAVWSFWKHQIQQNFCPDCNFSIAMSLGLVKDHLTSGTAFTALGNKAIFQIAAMPINSNKLQQRILFQKCADLIMCSIFEQVSVAVILLNVFCWCSVSVFTLWSWFFNTAIFNTAILTIWLSNVLVVFL